MNEKINQPYARLFEMVMGITIEARKLLQHFGDEKLVKSIDLKTLKTAHGTFKSGNSGLENFITDMLFTCKCEGRDAYVHLLLEHKSYLENPKEQILLYLILAYHQQRLDWKRKKEEVKQQGKDIPKEAFKPTPIIPIVFYHGKGKWKDYKFVDRFDLTEKWMANYIPAVDIFVINMAQFSDEYIENIGVSFLQPMLFMFKHKEDKNFLKQNTKKIFKFVQDLTPDKITKKYLKTIFYFMIQTFKLKKEEVNEIIQGLPTKNTTNMNMVQDTVMTALDEAEYNGVLIGQKKGEQITVLRSKIEMTLLLLKNFRPIKDVEVAILCKVEPTFVTKVRQVFEQNKETVIKQFTRETFKDIPHMVEKDFSEMEAVMLEFWKEFKTIKKEEKK